jgi:hypothetical protein
MLLKELALESIIGIYWRNRKQNFWYFTAEFTKLILLSINVKQKRICGNKMPTR